MSRTTRRKNPHGDMYWVTSELQRVEGSYQYVWVALDVQSDKYKKNLALYRSDAGYGSYGNGTAPHFYRRMCNKKATMKEKQEVKKFFKLLDYDPVLCPRVSSASWYF